MSREDKILEAGVAGLRKSEGLLNQFYDEYEKHFGKPCRGCFGKLEGYFKEYKQLKSDTMSEFELKPGSVIVWQKSGVFQHVTQANVNNPLKSKNGTFPMAVHLLADSRGYEKHFTKMPAGAWDMVEAFKGGKEVTFIDSLIEIKGIGKATAKKIAEDFENMDALKAAFDEGNLEYKEAVIAALTEHYAK